MNKSEKGYRANFTLAKDQYRLFPELAVRDNQDVLVLERLEESVRLFRVRFDDGYEANVWGTELICLHDGEEDASDCILGGVE